MSRKTIAVAMIVKNEEALLARCLESVKEADSIWILDTGSVDNTVSIARKYTDKVFLDYIWDDSFCGAQNYLLEKMRGQSDFVLSIDADEQLICPWSNVQEAVELAQNVVRVVMVAEGSLPNTFGFGRLFRNTPDIYWCQPIHKHLNVPGEGEEVGNVSIMYGYSPAHNLDPDRSLRMLENTVEKEGDRSCRNLYYLGREYWYKQRFKECTQTLGRYVQVSQWPSEKSEAFLVMSQAYSAQGLDEDARDAALQAIKINANFKEAIEWMAGICSEQENVIQWRRMAKHANNRDVLWKRVPVDPISDVIFLAPHNDDETLFGAFTLMRVKPLVIIVTDSYIQPQRGDKGCSAEERRQETINAMAIIGCPVVFLGIKDTELTEDILRDRLKYFNPERIYVPAIQGGNAQHDIVGKVGIELFGRKCEKYTTYTKDELYTKGTFEVNPVHDEIEIKNRMLDCYKSQMQFKWQSALFEAIKGRSEWLM